VKNLRNLAIRTSNKLNCVLIVIFGGKIIELQCAFGAENVCLNVSSAALTGF
jgi:hypothetical protein